MSNPNENRPMTHTMDLGVPEAYRHEAVAEASAADSAVQEIITVRCACGESWKLPTLIGTFYEFEDDDGPVPYLEMWEQHVWEAIKTAGQFNEATANSVESSDDDDSRWAESGFAGTPDREATARSLAWHYLTKIERRVQDAKAALDTPAGDFGQGTRIPTVRTWAQQISEQARWLQDDLNRIENEED